MTAPSDALVADVGNALRGVGPLREDLGTEQRVCETHGAFDSIGARYMGKREIWSSCPVCAEESAAAKRNGADEVEADRKRASIEEMMTQTCIPRRFIGRSFDSFIAETPEKKRALDICLAFSTRFEKVLKGGHSLVLSGGVGTGKSHLAGAILQGILPRHVGVYVTMLDLIRLLRETWRTGATHSESEVLSRLAGVPLLVVDEVGLQYGTDGERTLFADIMDRRYRNLMPVILLTNLTVQEFKETVGDRVHDRLSEMATWVVFDWPSHRPVARKAGQHG